MMQKQDEGVITRQITDLKEGFNFRAMDAPFDDVILGNNKKTLEPGDELNTKVDLLRKTSN